MFGLFKKKSEVEKLQLEYKKLMEEAHKLSTTNRKMSDNKTYEANEVLKEIDKIKAQKKNP
ncbi:Lacal_2735 family protein [Christiangramia sediminis]|uniref:Lacal_2735 family protein n=1 Tax=Christiangramia sediminis TaxID=2881336 RepID=A0A9X1RXL5_9FLAO|nr:Lacal_2735 family protein [Christiangramia sediminis]MCB7480545.1 Lacal_2735 family protein [Christiangramia sediminis]